MDQPKAAAPPRQIERDEPGEIGAQIVAALAAHEVARPAAERPQDGFWRDPLVAKPIDRRGRIAQMREGSRRILLVSMRRTDLRLSPPCRSTPARSSAYTLVREKQQRKAGRREALATG